jgi:hypothetical protein
MGKYYRNRVRINMFIFYQYKLFNRVTLIYLIFSSQFGSVKVSCNLSPFLLPDFENILSNKKTKFRKITFYRLFHLTVTVFPT